MTGEGAECCPAFSYVFFSFRSEFRTHTSVRKVESVVIKCIYQLAVVITSFPTAFVNQSGPSRIKKRRYEVAALVRSRVSRKCLGRVKRNHGRSSQSINHRIYSSALSDFRHRISEVFGRADRSGGRSSANNKLARNGCDLTSNPSFDTGKAVVQALIYMGLLSSLSNFFSFLEVAKVSSKVMSDRPSRHLLPYRARNRPLGVHCRSAR